MGIGLRPPTDRRWDRILNEKWLDAAYPGTAQQFIGALRAAGAQGYAWYLGGDEALHAWDLAIVKAVEAAGFHGMAVYVPFLDHPGTIDGADAVRLARAAGLPANYPICLDMEPGVFAAHPLAVDQAYAAGFNGQLHLAGFAAVSYGTPATVAAISNHADAIWVAIPGEPDPTTAGLTQAFFAGKRAVQWTSGLFNGIHCDLSTSEFSLAPQTFGGGAHSHPEEESMRVVVGDPKTAPAGYVDPSGPGAAYITNGLIKRHILTPAEETSLLNFCGQTAVDPIDQGMLDRMPRIESVPLADPGAAALNLGLLAKAAAGTVSATLVDLTPVLAAIADLKDHPSIAGDPVLLAKLTAIEANLNAPRPPA